MDPQLSILIPTYQNFQVVANCLISLIKYTEYPYQIFVLNNDASQAGRETLEQIKQTDFPYLHLYHLSGNQGWIGAINRGMELVDTPYVCLCNDDVVFVPGDNAFWRKLIRHLGGRVGAVGPSSNFVAGWQSLFMLDSPPSFQVKFLIGFCMVLRTEVFRKVGLLDETLPGGDDFDLSIRLRQAGYGLIAEKTAYVHHMGSLTGNKLYGQYWNSMEQQDQTNNALIRKHGLSTWYDTVSFPMIGRNDDPELDHALSEEDRWVEDKIKDGKPDHLTIGIRGANIGCGDDYREGMVNIDQVESGKFGAGGRKFTGAKVDLTAKADSIPLPDNSFDFILAKHLFEHLIDPVRALKEWTRLLKPYGRVILICPNHAADPDSMMVDYTHVAAYTPESLVNLLGVIGFRIKDVQCFPVATFGVEAFIGEKGL